MVKVSEVKVGTRLVAGDGFDCLDKGQICEVCKDDDDDLYVNCRDGDGLGYHEHYLIGEFSSGEEYYIGFDLSIEG